MTGGYGDHLVAPFSIPPFIVKRADVAKSAGRPPLIVVSNDDGIRSPGIRALASAMQAIGDVVVVAPDRERSAAGHSLTLSHPLRSDEIAPGWHAVDGTPTDCVNLAI